MHLGMSFNISVTVKALVTQKALQRLNGLGNSSDNGQSMQLLSVSLEGAHRGEATWTVGTLERLGYGFYND